MCGEFSCKILERTHRQKPASGGGLRPFTACCIVLCADQMPCFVHKIEDAHIFKRVIAHETFPNSM